MDEETLGSYKKSQNIAEEVVEFAKKTVEENGKVIDIAEKIEQKIFSLGGKPAFPVNVSVNEIAAHYTPDVNDTLVLKENDLVKIDIGVHVNGCIWDSAFSICIGKKSHPLIEASEKSLQEALKLIKSGAKVIEISEVVENTIAEFGFNPVRNLSGHGLEPFTQHAPPTIPNGKNNSQEEIKSGSVIAMETFATDGNGWVKESFPVLIFGFSADKPVRMWEARKILEMSKTDFGKLPFAKRWMKNISPLKLELAMKQLIDVEALRGYPILREEVGKKVAQSEQTVIVS